MIINQVVNNNTILALDQNGNEVVCFGRGIGFNHKKGDEISRDQIQKTFIMVDENEKNSFMSFVSEIPFELVAFGIRVTDYIQDCCSKKINKKHLLIPLVDHFYTTLERYREGIITDTNVLWNIQFLYREEYKIAQDIVDMLISFTNMEIDEGEANYITLHIINSEFDLATADGYRATSIVETAVRTVEEEFGIILNSKDIAYQRFIVHLQFLSKRIIQDSFIEDDIDDFVNVKYKYAQAYNCAIKIVNKLQQMNKKNISDNEVTYLTLHIARLLKSTK